VSVPPIAVVVRHQNAVVHVYLVVAGNEKSGQKESQTNVDESTMGSHDWGNG
jgi:hypothetical protein